eukprot:1612976-Prymnesium_polylepis.1
MPAVSSNVADERGWRQLYQPRTECTIAHDRHAALEQQREETSAAWREWRGAHVVEPGAARHALFAAKRRRLQRLNATSQRVDLVLWPVVYHQQCGVTLTSRFEQKLEALFFYSVEAVLDHEKVWAQRHEGFKAKSGESR